MIWVFFFKPQATYQSRFIDAVSPQSERPSEQKVEQTVVSENVSDATCEETLRSEVEKKDIEYQKGSILIAYDTGVSFESAVDVLPDYDLEWSGTVNEEDNFDERGWLTAKITSGDEFEAICSVRNSSKVRSATLNVLFELHQ